MSAIVSEIESLTLNVTEEMLVRSSPEATFAALLEELGPANEGREGVPMQMTLKA